MSRAHGRVAGGAHIRAMARAFTGERRLSYGSRLEMSFFESCIFKPTNTHLAISISKLDGTIEDSINKDFF
jgi:hypothetical protein